jgi:hypothetical protein
LDWLVGGSKTSDDRSLQLRRIGWCPPKTGVTGSNPVGQSPVRRQLTDAGALIVNALLDIPHRTSVPNVDLALDEMLAVIRHVRPRVVYLIESSFDLESEVFDSTGADEDDEAKSENGERHLASEKLVRKWRKHDGKPCLAFAGFAADGVLHTAIARPDWRDDFDDELEITREEIEKQREEESDGLSNRDDQEVREKAELLLNHASFNAGRISFEKRAFLAEHLFPGRIGAITRRAESLDWLKKSGYEL